MNSGITFIVNKLESQPITKVFGSQAIPTVDTIEKPNKKLKVEVKSISQSNIYLNLIFLVLIQTHQ